MIIIRDSCKNFPKVSTAIRGTRVSVSSIPIGMVTTSIYIAIEPIARCVHHTMQHHLVSLFVFKESAIHMQGGQTCYRLLRLSGHSH